MKPRQSSRFALSRFRAFARNEVPIVFIGAAVRFDRSDRTRSPRLAVVSFAFTDRNPERAIRIARISCGFRACRVVARLTDTGKPSIHGSFFFTRRILDFVRAPPPITSRACVFFSLRPAIWDGYLTDETRALCGIPAHETLSHHLHNKKMAVLQVNALFKKPAPAPAKKAAPAKKGSFQKKAAPAPKKAAPKKTVVRKAAPKKTVVRKAAPVKKTSGKPSQAGGDASKWYGTYLLLPPRSPSAETRIRHPQLSRLARARDRRDNIIARLDRIDETRVAPAFARHRAIRPVAISSRATRAPSRLRLHRVQPR